jgi:lipopolysaccharide assembly outer membrane protein LptD (OstA)
MHSPALIFGQVKNRIDSVQIKKDSVKIDSVSLKKKKKEVLTSKVDYFADDSIRLSVKSKMVHMYKNSKIVYDNFELTSERVNFNMEKSEVYANGIIDSVGKQIGKPHFKQGSEEFDANILSYNFKTKKAILEGVISKQEGGFLHAEKTKKQQNGDVDLINGKYTTCDAPHPHFYLALTKAVAIPNNKIVSGPAYIVMEDIPLPIGIPFGFFPSKKSGASGILIPTYGEEAQRGFYLRNGGYYFALSEHFDLRATADIYSKGTWGVATASAYKKRYKYNGNFNLRYYRNRVGDEGPLQQKSTDFSIQWNHSQEAQANPYQHFTANVNYSSLSMDKAQNYTNAPQYLTNQKSSSISFNKSWPNNSPLNLSVNLRQSQNSINKIVSFTLPSIAFNINRIYLFRGKNGSSGKWYDDIAISYTSSLENKIEAKEDSLFTAKTFKNMVNGFKHSIPFGTSFKLWKKMNLNLSPSLNYNGMVYTNQIHREVLPFYYNARKDTTYINYLKTDTIQKLSYAQGFSPSLSLSASPTIYGTFQFKKGARIQAIRHVIRPTASLSFVPSLKGIAPDYNRTYINAQGKSQQYSIYETNIYGTPSSSNTKSGSLSLSCFNNLEMKVRSAKDTLTGTKKIKLIDNLNFGTSYNIFADSMGWNPVSISASTTLFEKMNINVSGSMDLYALQPHELNGKIYYNRIKDFEFQKSGSLGRLTSINFSTGYSFQSGQGKKKTKDNEKPKTRNEMNDEYDYFNIPWSFSFSYDFSYSKPYKESTIIQSLRFNGDFSLTPKWKINFVSGYDIKNKQITYTTIGLDRDLHCWAMTFSCSPFGTTKFYNFQINVKSALLKDLKYDKHKSYYDYQSY